MRRYAALIALLVCTPLAAQDAPRFRVEASTVEREAPPLDEAAATSRYTVDARLTRGESHTPDRRFAVTAKALAATCDAGDALFSNGFE